MKPFPASVDRLIHNLSPTERKVLAARAAERRCSPREVLVRLLSAANTNGGGAGQVNKTGPVSRQNQFAVH